MARCYGRSFLKTDLKGAEQFIASALRRGRRVFAPARSTNRKYWFLVLADDHEHAQVWCGRQMVEITSL